MKTILGEYKIHNADIVLRSDCTAEELIDVVEGNRVYIPCIYILNKIDQISIEVGNQAIKVWKMYMYLVLEIVLIGSSLRGFVLMNIKREIFAPVLIFPPLSVGEIEIE